jgi:hypothetical protein
MQRFRTITILASLGAGFGAVLAAGQPAPGDLTLPARFRSMVMILDAHTPGTATVESGAAAGSDPGAMPRPGVTQPSGSTSLTQPRRSGDRSAHLAITIERWSTQEEQAALARALKAGGQRALVAEMEKATAGYVQVDGDLRWPIRLASTWTGHEGRVVRLATNSPIFNPAVPGRTPATDDAIGIVEFTVPAEGRGEGTLVAATRVEFDDRGRLQAVVTALGTGTQKLTQVARD